MSKEALEALFEYIDGTEERTRQRASTYFKQGRVAEIEGSEGRFVATVQGTKRYKVSLDFAGSWISECSCPVGTGCKHTVAAAWALMDMAKVNDTREKKQPTAKPTPAAPKRNLTAFEKEIEQRLGQPMTAPQRQSAKAIERLYENYGHTGLISVHALSGVVPTLRNEWIWTMHRVWDDLPKSPWETLLHLAHFSGKRSGGWPPLFREILNAEEVTEFFRNAERREMLKEWQERIRRMTVSPLAARAAGPPELRAVFEPEGVRIQIRTGTQQPFLPLKKARRGEMEREHLMGRLVLESSSRFLWDAFYRCAPVDGTILYTPQPERLNVLLRDTQLAPLLCTAAGDPFKTAPERLVWSLQPAETPTGDARLALVLPDGSPPPPPLVAVDGVPALYLTENTIYEAPPLAGLEPSATLSIPAEVIDSAGGVALLDRLQVPLPQRLADRVREVKAHVQISCSLLQDGFGPGERVILTSEASFQGAAPPLTLSPGGWSGRTVNRDEPATAEIIRLHPGPMHQIPSIIESLRASWVPQTQRWERVVGKNFPMEFAEWLLSLPPTLELKLSRDLASLRDGPVRATVQLAVEEHGIDWFDVRVQLQTEDTELTPDEIELLLKAKGGYVRLGAKGWRRLAFELSEADEASLADLGLSARELSSEPQRLHALQIAGRNAAHLMPERHAAMVRRRVDEIQARVTPDLPGAITATLRPYQLDGFHFLAYLTANRFGGILADDMGLGKTVQTLSWLAWLREQDSTRPSLVVCPKSVMDNWVAEAERFLPSLRVRLCRGSDAAACNMAGAEADLFVINYTQLRFLEKSVTAEPWQAVILDEAQAIKNPDSQTARVALLLKAAHRVALSGTPIENRLLDLWSIMNFAMPGVLGPRARFTRGFDQKSDPFARRRLAARVRPFVLRRTKGEVARDLPDRIEEDLHCEMEGDQAALYRAELKRARAQLLKLKTSRQLDKQRFTILTSLLRLRQICCHPALVNDASAKASSAKLSALMDLLEPLMEEGHKVLVFSQFVGMLELIQSEIEARGWQRFILTGGTEDRGALVSNFQGAKGSAVFLISLKAGGAGLNLTAASYVVLFDPWWNPAVENQAIDRTHRIGQVNKVIAYRLLVKETIEEKIRHLQKQKSALAADILGEENFARALTLDDFNFLLSDS